MSIECFMMIPNGTQRVWLRRYCPAADRPCPNHGAYHNGMTLIGDYQETRDAAGNIEPIPQEKFGDDPRWPAQCDCGHVFTLQDEFQVFKRTLYHAPRDNGIGTLEDAPAGAIWNATWLNDFPAYCGPDGQSLQVRLPGGHDWSMDGRASNCDSPCRHCGVPYHAHGGAVCKQYEDAHPHKCWVRTGVPPRLTVGKGQPGESCGAGAGSILVPNWHGFLRDGRLEGC